jgi:diadenosine tetraphosphate (Ap4A) HIT family hydrolase
MNAKTEYEGNDFYCDAVLNGRTQVRKLFETEHVPAFHHARPSYPVQVAVIPKKHMHWHVISGKVGDPAIPIGQNRAARPRRPNDPAHRSSVS